MNVSNAQSVGIIDHNLGATLEVNWLGLENDNRTVVVEDGIGSAEPSHQQGLRWLLSAGATLIGAKGLFYEWLPTGEGSFIS